MPASKRHIEPKTLAAVNLLCGAVSHELRRDILWTLAAGPMDVSSLSERHGRSITHMSNCLRLLRNAGLVQVERDSTRRVYSLTDQVRAIRHKKTKELIVDGPSGVRVSVHQPAASYRRAARPAPRVK